MTKEVPKGAAQRPPLELYFWRCPPIRWSGSLLPSLPLAAFKLQELRVGGNHLRPLNVLIPHTAHCRLDHEGEDHHVGSLSSTYHVQQVQELARRQLDGLGSCVMGLVHPKWFDEEMGCTKF